MTIQPALNFDEFARDTPALWRARAAREANVAPDALTTVTSEGLRIPPIAFVEDLAALPDLHTTPGVAPYLRGNGTPWQHWPQPGGNTPAAWNAAARLAQGYEPAALLLDLDATGITSATDLKTARAGISTPLIIECSAPAHHAWLLANSGWRGELWVDAESIIAAQPTAAHHTLQLRADASAHDAAGAGPVLGLALALSAAAEQTAMLAAHGWQIAQIAPLLTLRLAVGTDLLVEIARLRAARVLWARVAAAWGGDAAAQRLRIHAHTSGASGDSSATEAVRATLGALAAILGNCDALTVMPYDGASGAPTAVAQRLAFATPLLLRHETRLGELADAAGGAWAIETLTDQLARAVWSAFQRLMADGGSSGRLATTLIATASAQQAAAIVAGELTLVGVNRYRATSEEQP